MFCSFWKHLHVALFLFSLICVGCFHFSADFVALAWRGTFQLLCRGGMALMVQNHGIDFKALKVAHIDPLN